MPKFSFFVVRILLACIFGISLNQMKLGSSQHQCVFSQDVDSKRLHFQQIRVITFSSYSKTKLGTSEKQKSSEK